MGSRKGTPFQLAISSTPMMTKASYILSFLLRWMNQMSLTLKMARVRRDKRRISRLKKKVSLTNRNVR
jgi:hypothetical protein